MDNTPREAASNPGEFGKQGNHTREVEHALLRLGRDRLKAATGQGATCKLQSTSHVITYAQ